MCISHYTSKMFRLTLLLVTNGILIGTTVAERLDTAGYTHTLALAVSGYTGSSTLSGFPVLVRLGPSIAGFRYSDFTFDTGADLAFADTGGNRLAHEIDTWNRDGESLVWVKLPSMSKGTTFRAYYGKSDVSANDPSVVWSDYVSVHHFGEDSGTAYDATGHGYDGIPSGGLASGMVAYGKGAVGRARVNTSTFAGGAYLPLAGSESLTLGTIFHVSGWVLANDVRNFPRIVARKVHFAADNGWEFHLSRSPSMLTAHGASRTDLQASVPDTSEKWRHLAIVFNGAVATLYADGVKMTSGTIAPPRDNGYPIAFGNNSNGSEESLNGQYDEIRIRKSVPSADWVLAEYRTVVIPDFVKVQSVKSLAGARTFRAKPIAIGGEAEASSSADESDNLTAATQVASLTLDTAALTNDWEEAGISAYKCRIAFRDFGRNVADANAEAAAKRTQLDTTARVYLKSQMEKAQAEGDLDRVLVFKGALESARGGAITGDDEAVVKLRESYDRQLALADKTLLDAGLAAARTFAASLDEQKKEATKKGDLDDAQKIAAFQKKVGEWAKAVQGQAPQTVAELPVATPRPKQQSHPQPRQTVREVKPVEPTVFQERYLIIDLSAGANASSYPVTYLTEPPSDGFNMDEYKTTKLVLKRIEAGTFMMGGAIRTTLSKPFYIGLFEVTQKQWSLVTGSNPSNFSGDKLPVERVSYNAIRGSSAGAGWPSSSAVDASSFLGKVRARTGLDFNLPTEAQWEYACRAGTTTTYSYGDSANENYMWYTSNSSSQTHDVGTKQPNPWGLYDMHGNVWEWCLDWHARSLSGGTDPKGPYSGSTRVKRGGGWSNSVSYCVSSIRASKYPSIEDRNYGFRLAMTINQ